MADWPGTPDTQWPGTPEKKQDEPQGGVVGEFIKSIPTGAMNFASQFARGEQLESEQRAAAFGTPSAGPEIPTGDKATETFGLHKPKGIAGAAGELTGEFAVNPATYLGPGSAVAKFLTTAGAVFGGAVGREVGGTTGEVIGAVGGGLTPAAATRVATPILVQQARQAATQVLENEGVTAITAGQRTGNRSLRYAEGMLGDAPLAGGRATEQSEESGRQFTRAVLNRVGENSDVATPEVIDRAFDRIGGQMDAIAARTQLRMDQQFVSDMRAVEDEYLATTQEGARRPVVQNVLDDFLTRLVNSPSVGGEQFQAFRSRLLRLQREAFKDPEYSHALGGYVEAMDNALERSITNPADLDALRQARRQYRNLIPVAKAAAGAGEQSAEGIITPAKMRQALTSTDRGKRDYARGRGDYADLVQAGNLVMTPLPNSGTAQREMVRTFASILAGLAAGTATGNVTEGVGAAAAAAASGPGLMGRGLMSHPVQEYLGGRIPGQAAAQAAYGALPSPRATVFRSTVPTAPDVLQQLTGGQ